MPDKYINCVDCGMEFEHSERDQEFYAERDYSLPKRCKPCRIKKKNKFDKPYDGFPRARQGANEY